MAQRLLTIQDISCVGQCSLTVALPVISACGIETAVLPSSVLSNHTAFNSWTFNDLTFDIENIEKICNGLIKLGAKNVVLTGVSFEKAIP
ncbi:hypothetical protein [Treponema sp.]|uniref:hypothetical protein n=1 Tax=Treponema sp. TaxID=166 RepID=UPI003FD71FA6